MTSRTIRLAVIPGDGIGPEVVAEALKVVDVAAPTVAFDTTSYDLGAARWHRTGETLPDAVLEEIRAHDVILLGAVGDPSVPSGILERGLLLKLRFELDHYVNLRPVRLYPGVASPLTGVRPESVDMLVVREGTEGPYSGAGGVMHRGTPAEIATQESLNTAKGAARVGGGAASSPWCTRPTCSPTRETCGRARLTRSPRNFPRSPSTTVTSTRQPCSSSASHSGSMWCSQTTFSATSSRIWAPLWQAVSGWPRAATSIRSARRRPCSSRCTAALLTSRASTRPIPLPRSCQPQCCSST